MARFERGLKRAGIKLTHQRLEVCREIAASVVHPDVETVFRGVRKRIPTISLDTVYRTLWTLRDLGLIDTLGSPRDRLRFDCNTTPHHHFVCTNCGVTRDFHSEDLDRLSIPEEVSALGRADRTQVEVRGICVDCSARVGPQVELKELKG